MNAGGEVAKEFHFYVYIMASVSRRVLYIGVTNSPTRRVIEHKNGEIDRFSRQYKTYRLVYFETFQYVKNAIAREKEIKRWLRVRKNELVETKNPHWEDLGANWESTRPPRSKGSLQGDNSYRVIAYRECPMQLLEILAR